MLKRKLQLILNILLKQFEKKIELQQEVDRLEPLFKSEQEYKNFVKDHNRHVVKRGDLATYKGNCYLGIDAGSTTTKVALAGEEWRTSLQLLQ